MLPEVEPGAVIFNRLWLLAVLARRRRSAGIPLPQVPAVAAGYGLLGALGWRRQTRAVVAIEQRDGVEFWLERSRRSARRS